MINSTVDNDTVDRISSENKVKTGKNAIRLLLEKWKRKRELRRLYKKYKHGQEAINKLQEAYMACTNDERKKFREKSLAQDIKRTNSRYYGDLELCDSLIKLVLNISKAEGWEDFEFDKKLTTSLIEVVENYNPKNEKAIVNARNAVKALWHCNYYRAEFWEELLDHYDDQIVTFVLEKLMETEGGDEVLKRGASFLANRLYRGSLPGRWVAENFDRLPAETRENILKSFCEHGMPFGLSKILLKSLDDPKTRDTALSIIENGLRLHQKSYLRVELKLLLNDNIVNGPTESVLSSLVDIESTVMYNMATTMLKQIAQKLDALLKKDDADRERVSKILHNLKTLFNNLRLQMSAITRSFLNFTTLSEENAKNLENKLINTAKEFLDDQDTTKQICGYKVLLMLCRGGSEAARNALYELVKEMETIKENRNVSDFDRAFADIVIADMASLENEQF
ncbi:MAG: hypothetical protein QW590_00840 [Candidatus Bilamarchaeaceae archaeon]